MARRTTAEMAQNREGQEAPAIVGPSNRFEQELVAHGLTLRRGRLHTLQINLGRKCNQACRHCHVDAAPWRTEMIERETAERIAEWIRTHRPEIVDITGGAPELSEFFRFLVKVSRAAGAQEAERTSSTCGSAR